MRNAEISFSRKITREPINVTPRYGISRQIVSHSFKFNGSTHNLITDVVSALNLATNLSIGIRHEFISMNLQVKARGTCRVQQLLNRLLLLYFFSPESMIHKNIENAPPESVYIFIS